MGYPLDELLGEVAYVAYHLHWAYDEIMSMEHGERKRWVHEIDRFVAHSSRTWHAE